MAQEKFKPGFENVTGSPALIFIIISADVFCVVGGVVGVLLTGDVVVMGTTVEDVGYGSTAARFCSSKQ